MSGVNKVILLGHLGSEVKLRHLNDGRPVANVNIATSEVWRNQNGERQSHTEWHRLIFFGRQAEVVSQYMRKGSQIFVEGKLRTRNWQDKSGAERSTTEIVVGQFTMIGSRQQEEGQESRPAPARREESTQQQQPAADGGGAADEGDFEKLREDIPW